MIKNAIYKVSFRDSRNVFPDELLPCRLAPKSNVNHEMKIEHVWLLASRAAYSLPKPERDELLFQLSELLHKFIH